MRILYNPASVTLALLLPTFESFNLYAHVTEEDDKKASDVYAKLFLVSLFKKKTNKKAPLPKK